MLTVSDQWGRDRKTLNDNTPRMGWDGAHELV